MAIAERRRQAGSPAGIQAPQADWRRDWGLPALLLILAASFGLALHGIGASSLRGDEAFSITYARQDLVEVWRGLLLFETQPPLYYTALHYWMAVAGQSELAVRFASAFCGVLVVAISSRLALVLRAGRSAALAGAILAGLSPFLLWQSQDARMYTLLVASASASLLLALLVWQRLLDQGRAPRLLWLAYLAATLLSLYAHYGAIYALAAQNLALGAWLLLQRPRPAGLRRAPLVRKWLVAQAGLALGFLPWLAAAAPLLLGHTKSWIAAVSLPELLQRSLLAYTIGTTAGDLAILLAALSGAAFVAGAWRGLRAHPPEAAALLVYLFSPLLAGFLVSLSRPMFEERYFLFVLPSIWLTLAWLVSGPAGRDTPRAARPRLAPVLGVAAIILVCAFSLYSIHNYFSEPQYAKSPGWRELVQYVTAADQNGDVVIQNYPDPTLSYYLNTQVPLQLIPAAAGVQPPVIDRQMEQVAARARRIWFLPYQSVDWDAGGYVEQWLRQHAAFVSSARPGGIDLELYLVSTP